MALNARDLALTDYRLFRVQWSADSPSVLMIRKLEISSLLLTESGRIQKVCGQESTTDLCFQGISGFVNLRPGSEKLDNQFKAIKQPTIVIS